MKKNIFIKGCMVLAAVSMMSSCDDFLNEEPQSVYTADAFYSTDRDFQYAVNAIYAAQAEVLNAPGGSSWYSLYRWPSIRADEKSLYRGVNLYDDGASTFNDTETGATKDNIWKYMYIIISRSNAVLDRIDSHDFASASMKNELKGQALGLRAWAFYQLGIYFGGVPLVLNEVLDTEAKTIGRSTQSETFAQAAKDFKEAISLLPAKYTGDNLGRVGKYAAEAMLARMLMFENKNSEAKTYLEDVIKNGGYALVPNFVDAVNEAGEGNSERVWEVNYIPNQDGYGQAVTEGWIAEDYAFNPANTEANETYKLVTNGASHAISVNADLVSDHEAGDVRKNEYITNIKTCYSKDYTWYIKFTHYENFPANGSQWGINLNLIRYSDVLLMYAECLGEAKGSAYLDQVRNRAGLGTWKSAGYANFTEALRHERRVELAFEGVRWFDLVRWGIAEQVMNDYFHTQEGGMKTENGALSVQKFKPGRELFAIPITEIDLYGNEDLMWQNPGYK